MEILSIEATDETPRIFLNKKDALFEITGRSLPEDAAEFYSPVLDWMKRYEKEPNENTDFVFKLDYANTASVKFIQDILSILEDINGTRILWYYQQDDEDMEDLGHEFSELVDIPFEFKIF